MARTATECRAKVSTKHQVPASARSIFYVPDLISDLKIVVFVVEVLTVRTRWHLGMTGLAMQRNYPVSGTALKAATS